MVFCNCYKGERAWCLINTRVPGFHTTFIHFLSKLQINKKMGPLIIFTIGLSLTIWTISRKINNRKK